MALARYGLQSSVRLSAVATCAGPVNAVWQTLTCCVVGCCGCEAIRAPLEHYEKHNCCYHHHAQNQLRRVKADVEVGCLMVLPVDCFAWSVFRTTVQRSKRVWAIRN